MMASDLFRWDVASGGDRGYQFVEPNVEEPLGLLARFGEKPEREMGSAALL
jgi:hypothetical protein